MARSMLYTRMPYGDFKVGDEVEVANPIGLDRAYADTTGTFRGYSNPHGYAIIKTANRGVVLVHPESLTKVS
jgi:hypothetical protein